MLRQIVTGVLILFLTFWCGLVLAVLPALWQDGLNGIKHSLIHIAGGNGLCGGSSDGVTHSNKDTEGRRASRNDSLS